jgi:hypothetical protein
VTFEVATCRVGFTVVRERSNSHQARQMLPRSRSL